jgi:transcription elongation factor GreA
MDRNPISQEGYDKIREQIRYLEDVEMPKIAEKIGEARAEGDLSENAEYHGQREAQGLTQARINLLKNQLASSYIVDKSTMPKGIVAFGTRVTVKDCDDGSEEVYEFVGPGELKLPRTIQKLEITVIEET